MPKQNEPLALLTGVTRLGARWVKQLLQEGWQVAYCWHRAPPPELQLEAKTQPEHLKGFSCDLAQPGSALKLWTQVTVWAEKSPRLVVHAASVWHKDALSDVTEDAWFNSVRLQAWPLIPWTKQLVAAGVPASLIAILDSRTASSTPAEFSYGWGKRLASGLVTDLARQAAPLVRVNGLALGPVYPPEADEPRWDTWVKALPLRQQPPLSEVDQALFFLLHSTSVTGQIFHIDGGAHLSRGSN